MSIPAGWIVELDIRDAGHETPITLTTVDVPGGGVEAVRWYRGRIERHAITDESPIADCWRSTSDDLKRLAVDITRCCGTRQPRDQAVALAVLAGRVDQLREALFHVEVDESKARLEAARQARNGPLAETYDEALAERRARLALPA